ncbi:unnamed protein product [Pseudo-nitzschia multistriata]|uniref:Uncharacterized protein n=1 Tax=Pseudo-nitzschia multistriata TaxID=183589 RepID=A0A448ZSR8_9STRA|nr:unnamed protein product [Pseudo-nitzschia multistriata]
MHKTTAPSDKIEVRRRQRQHGSGVASAVACRLRNHATPRLRHVFGAVGSPVSFQVQQLLLVDGPAPVSPDQSDGVDRIHVGKLDEGNRHHDGSPSQAGDAVDGDAGPGALVVLRGAVVECLIDDLEPRVDDLFRRGVAVGVFHVVGRNPGILELSRLVGWLADPDQVRDRVLAHFPDVEMEVSLAGSIHNEEPERRFHLEESRLGSEDAVPSVHGSFVADHDSFAAVGSDAFLATGTGRR